MPPRSRTTDDPAEMSDEALATQTEQAALDAGTHVRLAVAYPIDVFDPSIGGVEQITRGGTLVPAEHEKAVRDSAKANAVTIRKV